MSCKDRVVDCLSTFFAFSFLFILNSCRHAVHSVCMCTTLDVFDLTSLCQCSRTRTTVQMMTVWMRMTPHSTAGTTRLDSNQTGTTIRETLVNALGLVREPRTGPWMTSRASPDVPPVSRGLRRWDRNREWPGGFLVLFL